MIPELDWLKHWSKYSSSAVALQSGDDGRTVTYGELLTQATRLASTLRSRFAIGRGDRLVCIATNELEYITLFFSCQRLGAILVPVNFPLLPAAILDLTPNRSSAVKPCAS